MRGDPPRRPWCSPPISVEILTKICLPRGKPTSLGQVSTQRRPKALVHWAMGSSAWMLDFTNVGLECLGDLT